MPDRVISIDENVFAYFCNGKGIDGTSDLVSQRDQRRELSEFEVSAFRENRKVSFTSLYLLEPLENDLSGVKEIKDQMKTLSYGKAGR